MIYFIGLAVILVGIFIDQLTKYLIVTNNVPSVVIPGLMRFQPTWNSGAAFSFLADKSWSQTFFIILTFIVCIALVAFMVFLFYKEKKKGAKVSKWLVISLSMILSGAIGNLVDRLMFHEVRDFINVFYNTSIFPAIFNFADCLLVVGVIMIIIFLLFLDKDALFKKKKKDQE